jgi:hypothetical protein
MGAHQNFIIAPTGAHQNTIVHANRCSAYHCLCTIVCSDGHSASHHSGQQMHIILCTNGRSDFFVAPTGTHQNIVCTNRRIPLFGLSLQSFSKHCPASHQAQNPSIVPPAIGHKINASCHQPSGAKSKHCNTSHRARH